MYETFYGLRRRPFAAAPDAEVTVETPAVAAALERLDRCVDQGRGIGVLTAASGMGKTHLCHRLAMLWTKRFRIALLPNAGFPTRRGLLQAILAELDQPYQRLGETELRLELTAVARAARSETGGIAVLLDEAHRYCERLLDEVRLIANLIEGGEPLVRIVLAGQVELEDKLSDPALAGLNERVGELVTLPRLTAEESHVYLRERTSFAGGTLDSLYDPAAAELIVRACGGSPRCLNQLADHGLLLGFVAERRPVDSALVREALEDLKRLPLQWHDPLPASDASAETGGLPAVTRSRPPASCESDNVIEIGGLAPDDEENVAPVLVSVRNGDSKAGATAVCDRVSDTSESRLARAVSPAASGRTGMAAPPNERHCQERPATEAVRDRFARIDAAEARRAWFQSLDRSDEPVAASPRASRIEKTGQLRPTGNPLEMLDRIEPLLAEALGESRKSNGTTADVHHFDGRAQLDRLVTALETKASGRVETTVPDEPRRRESRHSTLFSDLRRSRGPAAKRPGVPEEPLRASPAAEVT